MKIGIVTATYAPSKNGVATSTALFVRGLRELGHEVRVFAPAHPAAEPEPDVFRLPSTAVGAPKDYPLLLPASGARLPLQGLDLVHTMHPFVAGRLGLRWARRLRLPLVFTAHTQYHAYAHYAPVPEGLVRWAVARHVRAFAGRADLVLVPGRAMAAALESYGYRGESRLMPNPVDLRPFEGLDASWARRRCGILPDAPLLVFVGRLAPEKNLPALVAAFRLVQRAFPAARLLLVGDGPMRRELEAQAQGSGVLFVGALEHGEVPPYLAAADLFVTASLSETGSPMTFLEAFAAGTPVVAAALDAVAYDLLTPDNGLLCGPEPQALAGAVLSLLGEPPTLARLAAGALATARDHDVAAQARRLHRLYEEALARTGQAMG